MMTSEFTHKTDENLVTLYFNQAGKEPLLSRLEEIELSRRILAGDVKARQKLVSANLRLVITIAKNYRNPTVSFLDLIQEGNIGLIQASEKYDYRKNTKFSSYAALWIKQAISRCVAANQRILHQNVSFHDQKIDDGGRELIDVYEDHTYSPENETIGRNMKSEILRYFDKLAKVERQIIFDRYLLQKEKKQTLQTLADRYGFSAEGIRQIILRSLRKLRHLAPELQEYMVS